jgi:hypothetical protein
MVPIRKLKFEQIRVITKLSNSEQSYKGKVKTHNYINRQNQSTTGNCQNRNDPDLVQATGTPLKLKLDIKDQDGK